jgi:hypothetical protein
LQFGTADISAIGDRATHPHDAGEMVAEYQASGVGPWKNDPFNENRYRAERRTIADTDGRIKGDSAMPPRTHYAGHLPSLPRPPGWQLGQDQNWPVP